MTLKKFIKKNTTVLFLAGAALLTVIVLVFVVLSENTSDQDRSQLAGKELQNGQQESGVDGESFAQGQNAQVFQNEQPSMPNCPPASEAQAQNPNSNGLCDDGYSFCWSAASNKALCYIERVESQEPAVGECPNGNCPLNCSDLGGQCSSSIEGCDSRYLSNTNCSGQNPTCCVPIVTETYIPPEIDEDENESGSDDQVGGPGAPGAPGVPGMDPDDPNNFCGVQVTCGDCDQDCASGPGKCQTCTSADPGTTCSFSQACEATPENPIYEFTCGDGDFVADSEEKLRDFDEAQFGDRYQHKECTGASVCRGGPNTDGLYWCVDIIDDPSAPSDPSDGVVCDGNTAPRDVGDECPSRCGLVARCTDGNDRVTCVEENLCTDLNTPDPDPQDPGADPTDPTNFPKVTKLNPSTNKGTTTSSKLKLTISGEADKYGVYIHRGNPQPGDQVNPTYNKDDVPTTRFAYLGTTSTGNITFDSPTQVGPYKIAVNAINNKTSAGPEVVCSWHEDVYTRNNDGSLTQIQGESCENSGLINFTVEQEQAGAGGGNTSDPVKGLSISATTSPNCGGDVLITWTRPDETFPWQYYLYRGSSAGFTPSGSNMIEGPIGAPMTSPPYHDWNAAPGVQYYYKVLAYDGGSGNENITSNAASVTASPVCEN